MKVGIITIHNSHNYGACLQAFALYQYIVEQGHDVEMIDLYRPIHSRFTRSKKYKYMRTVKQSVFSLLKKNIKRLLISTKPALSVISQKKFNEFNTYIHLSSPYRSIDELYSSPPSYDLYITGSDQVWNPTQAYCIEPYFLGFVKNHGRKISYASSIGISSLLENEKCQFKEWLSSYDAISVRETTAKKILEGIVDKKVYQVADPTFLLSRGQWGKMAAHSSYQYENYLFLFTLTFDKTLFDYAQSLKKESGQELIYLCADYVPKKYRTNCLCITDAGPYDFLYLIVHANMIITNSFHCVVFSIIMQARNFYAYISKWNQRGSRITDLLSTYSLSSHILDTSLSQSYTELSRNEIEYDVVTRIYLQEQDKSRFFLESYL